MSKVSRSRSSIGWRTACKQIAAQQREDPLAFVKNQELFGDLATQPAFTEPYLQRTRVVAHPRLSRHAGGSRHAFLSRLSTSYRHRLCSGRSRLTCG